MDVSGSGKSPNTSFSFRYNANNEELEELSNICDEDPPTPQNDVSIGENSSPKKTEKSSILDKYFKSVKLDKAVEKPDETKSESKVTEDVKPASGLQKDITASPMKEYLNRLSKKSIIDADGKEVPNETWKIFHDFKYKIAQAVEDIKSRSNDDAKEKSVPRENSISDSEENSAMKDSDQQSVGDTDNQVSSLDSSIQNLSELTQPVTTKTNKEVTDRVKKNSESTDDTHKNLETNDSIDYTKDLQDDSSLLDIESGVEALEDINMEGPSDVSVPDAGLTGAFQTPGSSASPSPIHFHSPELIPQSTHKPAIEPARRYILNFPMYFLSFVLVASLLLLPDFHLWNGFLLGLWAFCLASNVKKWIVERFFSDWDDRSYFKLNRNQPANLTYTIPSVKEYKPIKKYEGWVNHYRYSDYDPFTYHIAKTTTAFMKLEGYNLRLSYTKTKVAKRALWDEQIDKVTFYQHRLYNLTGARVILMPKGLVKKRQWSKKYPICIVLNEKEKIQVLEKEGLPTERKPSESISVDKKGKDSKDQQTNDAESPNTSPEKKRKFVWRRKEKSIPHAETEPGKEGLRHRLVRKMHRDKKTDSSTCTEPESQADKHQQMDDTSFHEGEMELTRCAKDEADEDLDDTELIRIKEFLEEADSEATAESTVEGEWSIHVKHSKDGHSHLYLFARTGREKQEWYRRILSCITESNNSSQESSAAEDKSAASEGETKDDIELAVYKVADKDAVSFAKGSSKNESTSEVTFSISAPPPPVEDENPEKAFWPFLYKILQAKAASTSECPCPLLPAEVSWVNAMMARVVFDLMRDERAAAYLKTKLQRKLNTLKLPSIMSPLVVTEVSLSGACPLVEHLSAPSWDERGVWLDADIVYEGGAYVTVLTQINLMKLKEKNVSLEETLLNDADNELDMDSTTDQINEKLLMKRKPAIFDSDVEDSAESSSDDESPAVPAQPDTVDPPASDSQTTVESASSKKKFLRMVDKIATNKYFQQVTDYKYVKRAMEGLSNTDIKLRLELQALRGRLAINLPPPPHDRLWIGFRTNPHLILKARPAFGARSLRFAHITNWIEQKLCKEFEKVLVLPNMEDIIVDLMTPTPVKFE